MEKRRFPGNSEIVRKEGGGGSCAAFAMMAGRLTRGLGGALTVGLSYN